MLLSDTELEHYLEFGGLVVDPLGPDAVQPSSIDLRLGHIFRVMQNHTYPAIFPTREQPRLFRRYTVTSTEPFMLHPGEFVLGATVERVKLDAGIVGQLHGRSSLGRLGLQVHSTAGFIDPGFEGTITLELSNVATLPIELVPGMGIGQLAVQMLTSRAARPYGHPERNSKYQSQVDPEPSKFFND